MTNAQIGTVVIAVARRAERRIVEALVARDATRADRASPLSVERRMDRGALRRLIRGGAVRRVGDLYWYDVIGAERFRRYRAVRAFVGLLVLGLIVAGLIGWVATGG